MDKKNKEEKNISFYKYLFMIVIFLSLISLGVTYYLDLLPMKYFIVLVVLILFVDLVTFLLLRSKRIIIKILGFLFSIIYSLGLIWIINYGFDTVQFLKKIGSDNYNTENYEVYVLKDGNHKELLELIDKDIYYINNNSKGLELAFNKVNEKVEVNFIESSITEITEVITEDNAIMIEKSMIDIITENNEDFFDNLISVYSFTVEYKIDLDSKEVDITEEPFNVYISGIDSYSNISSVARSDVNIVATIDPVNGEILLTNIPRDYYVLLPSFGKQDKLTHAGVYGVDESISSLENLLDIEISYYVKLNFTTLIDVVEILDGIEVNSKHSFTSKDGYYFKTGLQDMNGKKALSFARERDAFSEGDRVRGENQQAVLEGIINKAISPSIITDYSKLLESLEGEFLTNITDEEISKLVKHQIDKNIDWNIRNISLDGSNGSNYTYTTPGQKLYVMIPDEESVESAKNEIKSIFVE